MLANKKLPVFIRTLLPQITDLSEYKRLSSDDAWRKQVILMCKDCHNVINNKFYD